MVSSKPTTPRAKEQGDEEGHDKQAADHAADNGAHGDFLGKRVGLHSVGACELLNGRGDCSRTGRLRGCSRRRLGGLAARYVRNF